MAPTEFNHAHAIDPSSPLNTSNLKGKSVVITGAASGIGEASMRAFISAGAFVTFGDLSRSRGTALETELGSSSVKFVPCDTRSWPDQANLLKTAHALRGRIDIVFANAGISGLDPVFAPSDPSAEEPAEPNLSILTTNLVGYMYTAKLALHYFARHPDASADRSLVMTASVAGYADHNGAVQYSAAKFGVRGMMRSLRQVVPALGVRVNLIAPWFVHTRIISGAALEKLQSHQIPFAQVEDVAAAVVRLASDEKANGRALAVVPREIEPYGYVDMEMDDDGKEDVIGRLQAKIKDVSIRVPAKE